MFKIKAILFFFFLGFYSFSQNDLDAVRYSQSGGVGGTARSMAMGGAYGSVGADLSCGAYNPAGLGLYRKSDFSFTGSMKITNHQAEIYNKKTNSAQANFAFNNFGIALAWNAENDPESRNVVSFSNTQSQNFYATTKMQGYTNTSSIAKDMLNLANDIAINSGLGSASYKYLYSDYEGMAFNTFLLDTADNKYFSFLDTKRAVNQSRELATTGRVNDINISYAYAYKDQFYFGLSLGLPRVKYTSTVTHKEFDDLDSMRVAFTSDTTFSDTYTEPLPAAYRDMLGFNNLTYTEYFSTTGTGINLKFGGIARLADDFRVGFYFHTPTLYSLTDTYYNVLSTSFDYAPNSPQTAKVPDMGGYYSYKITTPSRFSLNAAYVIKKMAVVAIDYEAVNYRNAKLKAEGNPFETANNALKTYYKTGHNVRIGGELNIKPVMIRAGYNMQGSPYGKVFFGDYVRNTLSFGAGVRIKEHFYLDATLYSTATSQAYYLFYTLDTQAKLKHRNTSLVVSAGVKF
ncbi:MAG: hypothetical protein KF900_05025 [Bacteroidetes bacterium]|nr:hypothetical protein [Bacteroidota bacterium]